MPPTIPPVLWSQIVRYFLKHLAGRPVAQKVGCHRRDCGESPQKHAAISFFFNTSSKEDEQTSLCCDGGNQSNKRKGKGSYRKGLGLKGSDYDCFFFLASFFLFQLFLLFRALRAISFLTPSSTIHSEEKRENQMRTRDGYQRG